MEFDTTTRVYFLDNGQTAQSVAYALAEYLDVKRNMITQTMRTKKGYLVQCKGDASAEWTKYLGMNAAVTIDLAVQDDELTVTIGTDKWLDKLGIGALGAVFFQPLAITAGIGALRQFTLPTVIYEYLDTLLEEVPLEKSVVETPVSICPKCGQENKGDALFCKACGAKLEEPEPVKIICENCGAELDGDEFFCPRCGKALH